MQILSSIVLIAVLALGIAEAKPSSTSHLAARNGATKTTSESCDSSSEFWYETRSCCLKKGGPSATPTPPSGVGCPSSWYFHHEQGCCVPSQPSQTATTPSCSNKGWSWSHGLQCCTKEPSKPTPTPTPSAKPGKGKPAQQHKIKRSYQWDTSMCPTGLQTCPIKVEGSFAGDFECVDTISDLTSCGGCVSLNKGVDCSKIANSKLASCEGGACVVQECKSGFIPSDDGLSCVSA
ncbi:hypothetical protein M0805_008941 [Coniferiporia weirii]|nr:hypothetical protein M0805_008941 [Coniferiporia weirii]